MAELPSQANLEWLYANAGPIVRWRMVRDLDYALGDADQRALYAQVLATDEVQRWLANLGGGQVHGSKDTCAENPMAKLVEYGLRAGEPALDAKMLPYAQRVGRYEPSWGSIVVAPFLIAAGYDDHPAVRSWWLERLETLYRTALRRDYDLYAPPEVAAQVPKAWRGKPIYKLEYTEGPWRLPTCYDLYAMAHWPCEDQTQRTRIAEVVTYLSDPRFQDTPGGYEWDRQRHRCYAAGRVFLACLNRNRLVLFMTLLARFAAARDQPWFRRALAELEGYRTERGTYILPSEHLGEQRDAYHIYGGAHMGLGEDRRRRGWREIESSFRVWHIQRLMSG
ncbi:MAG: hypothetical protein JXA74_04900 [Anaerolineae bacterium]|nr:hypothetical protein [Anaerolineae bacterium]